MKTSPHIEIGLHSAKLDKLWRRIRATDEVLNELLVTGEWDNTSLDDALDKYLKAADGYYPAFFHESSKRKGTK